VLAKVTLEPHPDSLPLPFTVGCKLSKVGGTVLKFEFVVVGDVSSVKNPAIGLAERTDGLWQTTCFEAFCRGADGSSYLELNFSPSKKWASYRFEGYRHGMAPALDMGAPDIFVEGDGGNRFALIAFQEVDTSLLDGELNVAISCIVELTNGTKSYWALRHPPGAPDFHHKDCFALKLAPPERA
jgi:hypothetical protein